MLSMLRTPPTAFIGLAVKAAPAAERCRCFSPSSIASMLAAKVVTEDAVINPKVS
jgi:hypothetical protein